MTKKPKIDAEIQSLLPAPSAEEKRILTEKLRAEGFREDLIVWKEQGILLDGHTRLSICEEYGIQYMVRSMAFPSRDKALEWVIQNQLGKRNLTPEQRASLIGREYLQKRRHLSEDGKIYHPQTNQVENKTLAEQLAEKHGVSEKTVRNYAAFAEAVDEIGSTDPEAKAEILAGQSDLTMTEVVEKVKPKRGPRKPEPVLLDSESNETEMRDAGGEIVPEQAREAFLQAALMSEIGRDIDDIKRRVMAVAAGPAGFLMQLEDIKISLKNARLGVTQAMPTHVCPLCQGKRANCQCCKGRGWTAAHVWTRLKAEQEAQAKRVK